jgi:glycosyltransferase involved in cell wall biosynthesis
MRLVIDGRRLTAERTGVGRYLEGLLAEWAATGLPCAETLVVLQDPSGRSRVPEARGLGAEVVGAGWPGLAWERWGLGRRLRPGDLLFAPTNLVPSCWSGPTLLVVFDTLLEAAPDGFPRHVRWRFGRRYRRAAARADRIIVPSRSTARDVRRFFGVEDGRIGVIPPGCDPGFQPYPPDSEEVRIARRELRLGDDPFFLFVGKRSRRRNVPAILEGFARFRRDQPRHRLVFVGPGGPTEGPEGVRFAGHVGEATLRGLLAAATALLYPSEYEGFGLPVVEAMASGCPVVTLRNSALTEAGGDAALYLESASPEAMACALHALATDPETRAGHVARGLDHAATLSRSRCAEAVKAEIAAMVARPHSRSA